MSDWSCMADGLVEEADPAKTGRNLNELIVGPAGSGKTLSNAYSRLLYTSESSVVVPIAKRAIKERFKKMFQDRGYEVIDLDYNCPENSSIGYDPLDFIYSDEEIVHLSTNLVEGDRKDGKGPDDPYWEKSAESAISGMISLEFIIAKDEHRLPSFAKVLERYRAMKIDYRNNNVAKTSLDPLFERVESRHPGNQASFLWKTVTDLAPRTLSCIFSIVNGAMDKIFSESIVEMMKKKKRIDFARLGKKRTALFITTSPMNLTLTNLVNLIYADLFRVLFEAAEKNEDYRLEVPVHFICDDFACSSRISKFESYISIFRAAGISVTLLLQSESQLEDMYGETAATTIINNCDTYVYMGGNDHMTCKHISERLNMPLHKVMSLPLEKVVVFRRGSEPFVSRRYQILEDQNYKTIILGNPDESLQKH